METPKALKTSFLLLHCSVFLLLAWLLLPNLDIDLYENFAWGQAFFWGTFKHPALFAWVTGIWFTIFPTTHLAYFVLCYTNAALGIYGILALAKLLYRKVPGQPQNLLAENIFLYLVLGFTLLGLPYNLYAAVFNADSILISLWPWTVYAFFSLHYSNQARNKWFWTILLGILSAGCIWGKYYSLILLGSLTMIALGFKSFRKEFVRPYFYLALIICLLLFAPHVMWEFKYEFPFRQYYSHYLQTPYVVILKHALTFVLTGFYFFAFSWIAWIILRVKISSSTNSIDKKISQPLLFVLIITPIVLTLFAALVGEISIKDRWAIPVWFALPILMANECVPYLEQLQTKLKVFSRLWIIFITLITVSFIYSITISNQYLNEHQDFSAAREAMVNHIEQQFKERFPNQRISWVAGNVWPDYIAPLAFYLSDHPRALPGFPNQMPALVNPYQAWDKKYGVIVCGRKQTDSPKVIEHCIQESRAWLLGLGLTVVEQEIKYEAQGWRWNLVNKPKQQVTVFWVSPHFAENRS